LCYNCLFIHRYLAYRATTRKPDKSITLPKNNMAGETILIVEDERPIARSLEYGLMEVKNLNR